MRIAVAWGRNAGSAYEISHLAERETTSGPVFQISKIPVETSYSLPALVAKLRGRENYDLWETYIIRD